MNLKKSTLSIALASALSSTVSQATVIDMDYSGLFTVLGSSGNVLQNTSYPYFGDTTWGYGKRTQISGTLQFNTNTGRGSATVNHFEFYDGGNLVISEFDLMASVGSPDLSIGNIRWAWGGSLIATQIVLDASGLFTELPSAALGDVYDASSCAASGACATPASNDVNSLSFLPPLEIGPALISTTSYNTAGQTGTLTTLGMLSLGTDDGIGGSPMDNGPFENFNFNFDFTHISVTGVSDPSAVPIPASVWLFASGIIGLSGMARRRKA